MSAIAWSRGHWTTEPAAVTEDGEDLLITAVKGSDAWRITSYGFVHDSEHALRMPGSWARTVRRICSWCG